MTPRFTFPEPIHAFLGRLGDVDTARARLERLASLILETSATLNLTSDRDAERFRVRHIEDALGAACVIETTIFRPDDATPILDVGSGGGIPGLVWAILWPGAPVTLLEATGKKAAFLECAARTLELEGVRVVNERAETLAHASDHRERYGLVTARAVAPMSVLAELTLPFVRLGGWVAAIKGVEIAEELAAAEGALARLGATGEPPQVCSYRRSDGASASVCFVSKARPTPSVYPRRPGVPVRRPLK